MTSDILGTTNSPFVANTLKLNNPIFPYFYEKFAGYTRKLPELGYAKYEFTMSQVDFTKDPPFPDPSGWIDWMKSKKGWHGVIVVQLMKVRDVRDETAAITLIQHAADLAKGTNVDIDIYPYTGTYIATAEQALPLVEKINRENVGITLQLIHEIKAGNSHRLPEVIAKIKDHLKLVIICGADQPKEGDDVANWDWSRLVKPLDEGNFDLYGFVKAVIASGYQGPFGQICWEIKEPALDYLTRSMATWKQFVGKIGK